MTRLIIGALAVGLALAVGAVAFSQSQRTANIEVRVWEDVNDPERNFISARPEGGSWRTLGTIPLPLTDGVSSSGRFRYGDITLAVPVPEARGVGSADWYRELAEANATAARRALDERDAALREVASLRAQLASRPAQTQRSTCDPAWIEQQAMLAAQGEARAIDANNATIRSLKEQARREGRPYYGSGEQGYNFAGLLNAARTRLEQRYCR